MGKFDSFQFTNTAAVATATVGTLMNINVEEYDKFSLTISHTATASISIRPVALNAGVSGAIRFNDPSVLGNTASNVATGVAETYFFDGSMERFKLKVSSTANIVSGAISVGFFGRRNT